MFLAQKDEFLQDLFQITAISLVSVINHFHINGCIYFKISCIWTKTICS